MVRNRSLGRRVALSYAFAVACTAAVGLIRAALEGSLSSHAPLLLFVLATLAAAAVGGTGPGLLATGLSAVLGATWFLAPRGTPRVADPGSRLALALYVVIGTFVSLVAGRMRREIERSERRARALAESEAALRELNQGLDRRVAERTAELESLLANAPVGFALIDSHCRYRRINPHLAELNGIPLRAHVGHRIQDVLPAVAALVEPIIRRVFATGDVIDGFELTGETPRSPGETRCWLMSFYPVRAEGGPVMFVGTVVMEITERKRLEQEREALLAGERVARTDADRVNRLKDEFLSTLSHELRTPLTAILGWSQILRKAGRAENAVEKGLAAIERNARRQEQLVADLLDVSRIAAGKVALELAPVDVAAVVNASMECVRPVAEEKGVKLDTSVAPIEGCVIGDAGRVQQIVWNLISNAVKFTPAGGRVEVSLEQKNDRLEIVVADTGQGIPIDFLPHLFERFRQADASATRRYGGLGLGLSIVKELTELHGGLVRAESAGPDKGSRFVVELPVQQWPVGIQTTDAPVRDTSHDSRPPDLARRRILVVDDEADAREMLKQLLERCGAEVVAVASARDALAVLAANRPDLLVSDIGMPDMDGCALLGAIRASEVPGAAKLPAIAVSAYARGEDAQRALGAGYFGYVVKPLHDDDLVALVARCLGSTESAASPFPGGPSTVH